MRSDNEAANRRDDDAEHINDTIESLGAIETSHAIELADDPGSVAAVEQIEEVAAREMARTENAQEKRVLYDAFVAAGHHPDPWDHSAHVGTIVDVARDTLVLHLGRSRFIHVPAIVRAALGDRVSVDRNGTIAPDREPRDAQTRSER